MGLTCLPTFPLSVSGTFSHLVSQSQILGLILDNDLPWPSCLFTVSVSPDLPIFLKSFTLSSSCTLWLSELCISFLDRLAASSAQTCSCFPSMPVLLLQLKHRTWISIYWKKFAVLYANVRLQTCYAYFLSYLSL